MSKWSRLKVAMLTAAVTLSAMSLNGCLGNDWWPRLQQYIAIGNLFD